MRLTDFFTAIHEYFAAGFFEIPNACYMRRHARAITRVLELGKLPPYNGTRLYPVGPCQLYNPDGDAVYSFFYPHAMRVAPAPGKTPAQTLFAKAQKAGITVSPRLGAAIHLAASDDAFNVTFLRGWTHSIINFERLLHDGLQTYVDRVTARIPQKPDFYEPLLEVLHAIQNYIARCEAYLREQHADALADVFHRMQTQPAHSLYEAFVYINFFWYIDDRDDGGRLDAVLESYRRDETDEEITALFHEHWLGYYHNWSWHVTFDPKLNWYQTGLKAAYGLHKPGTSMLIDDDTPQEAWDAIFDSWENGNTNPALYYRPNYYRGLDTIWNVKHEDYHRLAFGGCTELMMMGLSNVGSTDGNLHSLLVLSNTPLIHPSFDDFYAAFLANIRQQAAQAVRRCELGHELATIYQPNLIRTLFTDDCIDSGREFNDCGPRYNSGLIGVTGLTNVVNAIYNLRLAYQGKFDLKTLEHALDTDFSDAPELLQQLLDTPKFGNDIEDIDTLATQIIHDVFSAVAVQSRPHRTYIPFINLFTTYAYRGSYIPATADGRRDGAPVGDSFGAVQGTDTSGPTALLNSVTKPDQQQALGTPVMNLRLSKAMVTTPEARALTKALLMTYFHRGGLQIQVTILDSAALKDAMVHPENYQHLMVRIGGYSEYFTRLSREVQLEVLKRSEHTI